LYIQKYFNPVGVAPYPHPLLQRSFIRSFARSTAYTRISYSYRDERELTFASPLECSDSFRHEVYDTYMCTISAHFWRFTYPGSHKHTLPSKRAGGSDRPVQRQLPGHALSVCAGQARAGLVGVGIHPPRQIRVHISNTPAAVASYGRPPTVCGGGVHI